MVEFSSTPDDGITEDNPLAGVTIRLDGQEFPCDGELSLLETSDLAAVAVKGSDISEAAQAAAVAFTLEQAFGPAVYAQFRVWTRGDPAAKPPRPRTPNRVVLAILAEINEKIQEATEEMTGRPTQPPVNSSPGLEDPGDRISRIVSFQRGDVTIVDPPGGTNPAAGKQPANTTTTRVGHGGGGRKRTPRSKAG